MSPDCALFNALAPDADMPWSCEGEPAVQFADVDGAAGLDVVALYPFRAPSGARFTWPLVPTCRKQGSVHALDVARTVWLRAQATQRPVRTRATAVRLPAGFTPR